MLTNLFLPMCPYIHARWSASDLLCTNIAEAEERERLRKERQTKKLKADKDGPTTGDVTDSVAQSRHVERYMGTVGEGKEGVVQAEASEERMAQEKSFFS